MLKGGAIVRKNDVILAKTTDISLDQTLDCGQAFRWNRQEDGSFIGVAFQKLCHISQEGSSVILHNVNARDFDAYWFDYFDLGRDYTALRRQFSADPTLARVISYAPGIRVLRQEPWEALCSFIISQNNNVGRIKGIVARLCELLGAPLGDGFFAFPTPDALAACTPDDLAPLRAGFRARYLIDAAQRTCSGEVDLAALRILPLEEARAALMRIVGVGVKVADCALLYGCGRVDCFPIDVWIRRAMESLFPNGLPDCAHDCAGIAQQYIFHYIRTNPDL